MNFEGIPSNPVQGLSSRRPQGKLCAKMHPRFTVQGRRVRAEGAMLLRGLGNCIT